MRAKETTQISNFIAGDRRRVINYGPVPYGPTIHHTAAGFSVHGPHAEIEAEMDGREKNIFPALVTPIAPGQAAESFFAAMNHLLKKGRAFPR